MFDDLRSDLTVIWQEIQSKLKQAFKYLLNDYYESLTVGRNLLLVEFPSSDKKVLLPIQDCTKFSARVSS